MSGFRYVSFASIFALIYTGVVLFVELPDYYQKYHDNAIIEPAILSVDLFTSAAKTFFAYTCQI